MITKSRFEVFKFWILSLWLLVLLYSSAFTPALCHLRKPGSLLNKVVDEVANKTMLLLQIKRGYRLVHSLKVNDLKQTCNSFVEKKPSSSWNTFRSKFFLFTSIRMSCFAKNSPIYYLLGQIFSSVTVNTPGWLLSHCFQADVYKNNKNYVLVKSSYKFVSVIDNSDHKSLVVCIFKTFSKQCCLDYCIKRRKKILSFIETYGLDILKTLHFVFLTFLDWKIQFFMTHNKYLFTKTILLTMI